MTTLSQDKKNLLNKLYNLKGEDNIIIKKISENIENTMNLIKETTDQRIDNESKKIDCEGKLSMFESQKETFSSVFNGLDNDTFDALRGIGINIEIGTMLDTIEKKSPNYIKQLNEKIDDYASKIEANNQKIDELSENLNSLRTEKSHNEDSRDKLNKLLDQSLSPDETERESLTTSHVKKVLSLFEIFNTSDINSLTKLIIFPDEGLYEYIDILDGKEPVLDNEEENPEPTINLDEEIPNEVAESEEDDSDVANEGSASSTNEIEVELEETTDETEDKKEDKEDIYIPIVEEDTKDKTLDIYQDIADKEELDNSLNLFDDLEKTSMMSNLNLPSDETDELSDDNQHNEDEKTEEASEFEKEVEISNDDSGKIEQDSETQEIKLNNEELDRIETFIEEQGLSVDMFSDINNEPSSTILKSFAGSDLDTVKENYEILRSLNASEQAIYKFTDNYSYLIDADFNKKITLLRIKNVSEHKIKDLLEENNAGLRVNIKTFEDRIKALEDFNTITDENIGGIADDVIKFKDNYNEFVKNGFELEEKEVRNFEKVILESTNIHENMVILKNYLISIIRKNGKYALSVFWKKPYELLTDIDDLIEADLEELIISHPEILAEKNTEVLKRVKYCEDNVIPLLESNNDTSFCDYIYSYLKFAEKFEDAELPTLIEHDAINNILKKQLNEDLVTILDNYYENTRVYDEITLDDQDKTKFDKLKNQILDELNADSPSKYTYKLGNTFISKNKYERNLSILINSLSKVSSDVDDKKIILVAALYNSRHNAKSINNLIDDVMSGNIPIGGNEE